MKKMMIVLLALAVVSVSSCGWTKQKLGFSRQGPDETLVKTNEPLILPPEYGVRPQKNETANENYWEENSENE